MTDTLGIALLAIVVVVILLIILGSSAKMIRPYEVGVVTAFGAYKGKILPGLNFVNPLMRVQRVDMRAREVDLPAWNFSTSTGPVTVSATASFKVTDPARSIFATANLDAELGSRIRAATLGAFDGPNALLPGVSDSRLSEEVAARVSEGAGSLGITIESLVVVRP